jgi:hypothetical protein
MTTASWATPADHTTTTGYRTWGSELNTKFAAVGMVQTSDTGQINWSTITLPAANTTNGYEIWRLSGSALFFKITYGTGNNTNAAEIQIQVGTGSNGSGTLTGTLSTAVGCRTSNGQAITSPTTNYQSYLCATADYFMLSWKIGAASGASTAGFNFLTVLRTVDSTGAATSVGYFVFAGASGSGFWQNVATAAGVAGTAGVITANRFCMVFGSTVATPPTSQDGSGNNQAFLWWFSVLGATPVLPLLHAATVLATDLVLGATASLTMVGSTAHTYINASAFFGNGFDSNPVGAAIGIAALWE